MGSATERFVSAAADLGVVVDVHHYPEGTRTAAEAAAAIGCDVGEIVKSLVLVVNGRAVIALTSGRNRVDLARLAGVVGGSQARPATAHEARDATGYAIGGTPPFGYTGDLGVFFDPDLLQYQTVWAAAGTPDTCFPIAPQELAAAAGATTADFTE